MESKNVSSVISPSPSGIPFTGMSILSAPMKAEPFNVWLGRVMDERDITPIRLIERAREQRYELGLTSLRQILRGETADPRIGTLKAIAAGLDMPYLDLVAHTMDEPQADESGFSESHFGMLWRIYREKTAAGKNQADFLVNMLADALRKLPSTK